MINCEEFIDTFDHVVVLMMENRSFDNLLGFFHPGEPAGPAQMAHRV